MFRYLVRRTLWAIVLFLVIMFTTFVIFFMAPQDPARAVCGGDQARHECLVRATAKLGLDKPILEQYRRFLGRLLPLSTPYTRGHFTTPHFKTPSLGTAFDTGVSLNQTIYKAAPVTASLVFGG